MMGLGFVVKVSGENSSSSISNLSALAPPFTVDRWNLNPMLSSNPVLNYSELSYAVEPSSHTSQFASPSAPGHDLDIHPTETTSMPLNDYQISDSVYLGPSGVHWSDSALVYGGGVKPYYSLSVPPMIGEGSTINEFDGQCRNAISPSGLSASSQLGYNQSLFDLEHGPRWADNVGFSNVMRVKTVGPGGDFSSKSVNVGGSQSYKIQVSQGIYDIPFGQKSQEVSGTPCGNLNRVSDSEVHYGQLALGNLEDRPFLGQNADLLPYDCIKPCISVSASIFPESYSFGQTCEMYQNASNFQNQCGPYETHVFPFDPSFSSSVSVVRASPSVVSRLPPSVNDFLGKDVASCRTSRTDNVAVVDFEQSGPSKRKNYSPIPNYYLKENFLLPVSGKELTGPMQSKNNFPLEFRARVGSQLPDINVSSGFSISCDSNQVVSSALDSSGFVDHRYPSVDSPCWKGAPSSLFSTFDVGSKDPLKKNLDQCYFFDHIEHQNLRSLCDSTKAFSKKGGEGNNNEDNSCGRNSVYSLEGTLYANSSNREPNISDFAKPFARTSAMTSSEGIQISNQPNFHNEPSNPRNSESKEPKSKKCLRDTSAIIEESHSVDKISAWPYMTKETFNSYVQPNYRHMGEETKTESPVCSPLRGGEGIKRNDDMTKAIKKLLEENFHCNEDISSQALLFKSMWLVAEANLCSIGCKARFDQMKIEMGSEDDAEMMSKIRSMPDPNTDSRPTPKTHGGTSLSPALKSSFISSTTENANDVEASIMDRFKILKSRGDNVESIDVEKERQLDMGDSEHAGSIMERFNILKSQENNLTCTNKAKKPHPEMVNNEHAESVMARFNILQSRDSGISVKEAQRADMVDVEFSGKKNVAAVQNAQSEAEVFSLSPKPYQTGSLSDHKFGSKLDGCGYNSPRELHFFVPNDPMVLSFDNRKIMNQCFSRLHDSSLSSDWEHVWKDDLAWKNL